MLFIMFTRTRFLSLFVFSFFLISSLISLMGCASYQWGSGQRRIPGGYKRVFIPLFKNKTKEVGSEIFFTNAMINEVERAGVGSVVGLSVSEVTIEGEISSIQIKPESLVNSDASEILPRGSILATNFRMIVTVHIRVRRNSDEKVLWQGHFEGERLYPASQVTVRGVNTVNPLYNHSIQKQNMALVARDVIGEAYDQMTESF